MIKVMTLNLNGIRSATRKGFADWLAVQDVDVVCVQEIKAAMEDIEPALHTIGPFQGHFFPAEKKGYAGVGLYTRKKPKAIKRGFGVPEFDNEGRYIEADFGAYVVISLYSPSGSASEERFASKLRFLEVFYPHLQALKDSGKEVIVCADWNIAHKEIDLKNWKSNLKNAGFTPQERAWLTRVIDELGYVDTFRQLDPRPEQYSWWSNRGAAYENNVGWRLDYHLVTPSLAAKAKACSIFKEQRFSDHSPVTVEYAIKA
jgi:exodeoxyribonuclease III